MAKQEVTVQWDMWRCDCAPEGYVQDSFNRPDTASRVTHQKLLELWWAPIEYETIKYRGNKVIFVPKDKLLPYPWWLVRKLWGSNKWGDYVSTEAYRCLLIHISIGYGTSAVLDTFPMSGTFLHYLRKTWIIDKLKGLPIDYLRVNQYYQNVDGQLFQWPFMYKSYIMTSLPVEDIITVLEGPLHIKLSRTEYHSNKEDLIKRGVYLKALLTKPVEVYVDGTCVKGDLALLTDYSWVIRDPLYKSEIPVNVAPYNENMGCTLPIPLNREVPISIAENTLCGINIPLQRRTVTITNLSQGSHSSYIAHNPGITITVDGCEVEVDKLVVVSWCNKYLVLKGVNGRIPFNSHYRQSHNHRDITTKGGMLLTY